MPTKLSSWLCHEQQTAFLAVLGQPKKNARRMLEYDWLPHLVQKYLVDDADVQQNQSIPIFPKAKNLMVKKHG